MAEEAIAGQLEGERLRRLNDNRNLSLPEFSNTETPDTETENEDDVANQMQSSRMQRRQASQTTTGEKKKEELGSAAAALIGKSGIGTALLTGIKWIIKGIRFCFGEKSIIEQFLVTTWLIGLFVNLLLFWIPVIGSMLAFAISAVFAIPLCSFIYPKIKPYIDGALKDSFGPAAINPVKK